MAFKVNQRLLPVKAHYFFFFASMGCILGQINVIGKQIGVTPSVMGIITAILPLSSTLAKPLFGCLADMFQTKRKSIFLTAIVLSSIFLSSMYFAQTPEGYKYSVNSNKTENQSMSLSESEISEFWNDTLVEDSKDDTLVEDSKDDSLKSKKVYLSIKFWIYVMFALLGTIFFNIVSSISDAICFDVLGEKHNMKYGAQRLWGTLGYGVTALVGGVMIDYSSPDPNMKDFLWVCLLCLAMCFVDLCCCWKLKLPLMHMPEKAAYQLKEIFSNGKIWIFLIFSALAGVLDSFVLYFMFWYLEEMAHNTPYMANIKIIEGLTVAAECFGSEILVFAYSGRIIKTLGYRHTLSLSLLSYGVRFFLMSFIQNPWQNIGISVIFQGPTFALCYSSIIGRAAALAPPGLSATLQGVVAGVYEGIGYCMGSLLGGTLYGLVGGRWTFRILGSVACIAAIIHVLMTITVFKVERDVIPDAGEEEVKESPEDKLYKEQSEKLTNGVETTR